MPARLILRSLYGMGFALNVVALTVGFLVGIPLVDPFATVVLLATRALSKGGRRAPGVLLLTLMFYLLVGIVLTLVAMQEWGGLATAYKQSPWLIGYLFAVITWSGLNFVLVTEHLRQSDDGQRD